MLFVERSAETSADALLDGGGVFVEGEHAALR
jgi:hypothetical protein